MYTVVPDTTPLVGVPVGVFVYPNSVSFRIGRSSTKASPTSTCMDPPVKLIVTVSGSAPKPGGGTVSRSVYLPRDSPPTSNSPGRPSRSTSPASMSPSTLSTTVRHSSGMSTNWPFTKLCVRHSSNVAPPRGCALLSTLCHEMLQSGKPTGPAKSFSSAVNDCELRVFPITTEMHGVSPATAVTSIPNSVKAFFGSVVISIPWRS